MVIGECGVGGENAHQKMKNFRKGQEATTKMAEFKDTTAFVPTAKYWDEDEAFKSNGGYHYNGNGKIYYFKGKAMALAMHKLLPETSERHQKIVKAKAEIDGLLKEEEYYAAFVFAIGFGEISFGQRRIAAFCGCHYLWNGA